MAGLYEPHQPAMISRACLLKDSISILIWSTQKSCKMLEVPIPSSWKVCFPSAIQILYLWFVFNQKGPWPCSAQLSNHYTSKKSEQMGQCSKPPACLGLASSQRSFHSPQPIHKLQALLGSAAPDAFGSSVELWVSERVCSKQIFFLIGKQ